MMFEYGVSKRTILRDIEFLRDRYDAPVEADRKKKGYYYSDPTFAIQNVLLTEGDLFTVSTILPLMEQYKNTPLESSFKNIMAKITDLLPAQVTVDTGFLNTDISFIGDPLPKIESETFEKIFEAIKIKKVINFKYKNVSSMEYKYKTFAPYRIVCQKGNWYVFGYDYEADDKRIYSLSRFKDIILSKEQYKIPQDFDIAKEIDLSFGIWYNKEEPVEYELVFDKSWSNYILERDWHKDQVMEQREDGSVYLKFKSNQRQQILNWVLGFGGAVTVLSPETLKDELKKAAEDIMKKYGK